jgi:hypothetical protein
MIGGIAFIEFGDLGGGDVDADDAVAAGGEAAGGHGADIAEAENGDIHRAGRLAGCGGRVAFEVRWVGGGNSLDIVWAAA